MSDYLTKLAERAVGAAEAIEPRVPYRFERAVDILPGIPFAEWNDERPTGMDDEGPLHDRFADDPPLFRANDPGPPEPHARDRPFRDVSRVPHQPMSGTDPSAVPSDPRPKPVKSSPVASPRTRTVLDSQPEARLDLLPWKDAPATAKAGTDGRTGQANIVRPMTESQPARPGPPAAIPIPAAAAPRAATTQLEPVKRSGAAVRRSSVGTPDETRPTLRPRNKEERGVRRAVAESFTDRGAERRQEPTVRVTIGRVEVRAVMEPRRAPSRPRRAAKSAISLDEYLKRHEERRR
jgi:hypothetical protein